MARLPDPAVRRRWKELIALQLQSDLTVADFCNLHNVSAASFYCWRRKIDPPHETGGEFLPVQLANFTPRPATVRFSCGAQIELDARDTQGLRLIVDRLVDHSGQVTQ